MNIEFPKELEPYQKVFESSLRPVIKISTENLNTNITDSKFGGIPYYPQNRKYPIGSDGNPLAFLAQINFEQMPQNDFLPSKGIIQFYINQDTYLGMGNNDFIEQKNYRVIYFDKICDLDNCMSNFDFYEYKKDFPVKKEFKLMFELDNEFVNTTDELMFHKIFSKDPIDFFNDEELFEDEDAAEKHFNEFSGFAWTHKIGGYPFFLRNDPRRYNENLSRYDSVLLQIKSERFEGICYGMREGVANFMINEQDLKNKDFSKIMYFWSD